MSFSTLSPHLIPKHPGCGQISNVRVCVCSGFSTSALGRGIIPNYPEITQSFDVFGSSGMKLTVARDYVFVGFCIPFLTSASVFSLLKTSM